MTAPGAFFALMRAARSVVVGNAGRKLTLCQIVERLGEDDGRWTCFPSVETIAVESEQHRATVLRHLAYFEEVGLLVREARGSGPGGRYASLLVAGPALLEAAGLTISESHIAIPADRSESHPARLRVASSHARDPLLEEPQEEPTTRALAFVDEPGIEGWDCPAIVRDGGYLTAAVALCVYFAGQVAERGDSKAASKACSKAWVLPMEAMVRLDGHDPESIRRVMDWLHAGRDEPSAFWRTNVLSPAKLRERWDQMATQYAAAKRGKPSKSSAVLQPPGAPRLADRLGANRG